MDLKKLILGILIGISFYGTAHSQQSCQNLFLNTAEIANGSFPEIPEEYQEDIYLSQGFNTPYRVNDILPEKTRIPVKLYQFDLPRAQAKLTVSHLDSKTEKLVYITKKGKPYVRFYIVQEENARFSEIKSMLDGWHIPLEQKLWAVRLQSQYTFFVWNPENPRSEPFYLKIQKKYRSGVVRNNAGDAEAAIKTDQMVEEILRDDPSDFTTLLPERLASSLDINGVEFANSFRSVKPIKKLKKDVKFWTANGFFGSSKIAEVANKMGLSVDEWTKKEFLPKLARSIAEMSYRYGIVPEGHTQNITIAINESTGKIERFILKDLADILYDPFALIAQGKNTHSEAIRGLKKVARMNHIPVEGEYTKGPGGMISAYTSQSVIRLTTDIDKQREYAQIFLKSYIEAAEEFTGHKVNLSTWTQARYDKLFAQGPLKPWWENAPDDYDKTQLVNDFIYRIVDGVYDSVTNARLPIVQPEMETFDQNVLAKIVQQAHVRLDVAFPARNGLEFFNQPEKFQSLKYAFDGKGIIIYSLSNKSKVVVAYAHSLFENEVLEVIASKIK